MSKMNSKWTYSQCKSKFSLYRVIFQLQNFKPLRSNRLNNDQDLLVIKNTQDTLASLSDQTRTSNVVRIYFPKKIKHKIIYSILSKKKLFKKYFYQLRTFNQNYSAYFSNPVVVERSRSIINKVKVIYCLNVQFVRFIVSHFHVYLILD